MKKLFVIAVLLGVYHNWTSITNVVFGAPDYAAAGNQVVMYATEWCGYCQKTREFFADNNIPYVEHDIEKSNRAHREYRRLGGRGVPVVTVNGSVIHGYAPEQILGSLHR